MRMSNIVQGSNRQVERPLYWSSPGFSVRSFDVEKICEASWKSSLNCCQTSPVISEKNILFFAMHLFTICTTAGCICWLWLRCFHQWSKVNESYGNYAVRRGGAEASRMQPGLALLVFLKWPLAPKFESTEVSSHFYSIYILQLPKSV